MTQKVGRNSSCSFRLPTICFVVRSSFIRSGNDREGLFLLLSFPPAIASSNLGFGGGHRCGRGCVGLWVCRTLLIWKGIPFSPSFRGRSQLRGGGKGEENLWSEAAAAAAGRQKGFFSLRFRENQVGEEEGHIPSAALLRDLERRFLFLLLLSTYAGSHRGKGRGLKWPARLIPSPPFPPNKESKTLFRSQPPPVAFLYPSLPHVKVTSREWDSSERPFHGRKKQS